MEESLKESLLRGDVSSDCWRLLAVDVVVVVSGCWRLILSLVVVVAFEIFHSCCGCWWLFMVVVVGGCSCWWL